VSNPPWFYLPPAAERDVLCDPKNKANIIHFTCDPVGHVMTIAWRHVFFGYIQKYLRTNMSASPPRSLLQQANKYVSMWTEQYRPSVTQQSALGGLPTLEDFNQQPTVVLQMFASGLTELSTRAVACCEGAIGWSKPFSTAAGNTPSTSLALATAWVARLGNSPVAMVFAFVAGAASCGAAQCFLGPSKHMRHELLLG